MPLLSHDAGASRRFNLSNVIGASFGEMHALALDAGGSVWAVGDGNQLCIVVLIPM